MRKNSFFAAEKKMFWVLIFSLLFQLFSLDALSQTCKSILTPISSSSESFLYDSFDDLEVMLNTDMEDEILDLHLELAAARLYDNGVVFTRLNDILIIDVNDNGLTHPFNIQARHLLSEFGVSLIYDPLSLAFENSAAFVSETRKHMLPIAMSLSIEALVNGSLGANEFHEYIHVKRSLYRKGLVKEGYISDAVVVDRPVNNGQGSSGYSYLSVEEIEAYLESYRFLLDEARRFNVDEVQAVEDLSINLNRINLISKDIMASFSMAFKKLKANKLDFKVNGGSLVSDGMLIERILRSEQTSHFKVSIKTSLGIVVVFTRKPLLFNKRTRYLLRESQEEVLENILTQVRQHLRDVISYSAQAERLSGVGPVNNFHEAEEVFNRLNILVRSFF